LAFICQRRIRVIEGEALYFGGIVSSIVFRQLYIAMVQPKVEKIATDNCKDKEEVLFNSDALSRIVSYLPSVDVFNLALTSKRFGVSSDDDESSLIKDSVRIAIQDNATEDELAILPYYNGKNSLTDYHYLQFMRGPLTFDQLGVGAEYVDSEDKSCVRYSGGYWGTAFSNNILRVGKHYATFIAYNNSFDGVLDARMGVMRPGQANQDARYGTPISNGFYQNFSQVGNGEHNNNNNIQCCMYNVSTGFCYTSDWESDRPAIVTWDGSEHVYSGDELGMLLNLDEGTLSIYKNGRKLGVATRGLAGPYCWVVSMSTGVQFSMKRGTIPL